MVSQRPKHEETHTASNNPYTYHFFKAELMHKRNTPHNILRPGANQEHHVSVSVSCLIFTRHTLERPRYIPPAAQFEGQRGTDLRQPPASSMSQYQKTQTVSQFYDKILAKTGTLEVEIKVDTKVAKQLMPKLKVKKNKVDTQVDSKVERSKTVDSKKNVQKLKGSAEATPVDTDGFAGGNQSEDIRSGLQLGYQGNTTNDAEILMI